MLRGQNLFRRVKKPTEPNETEYNSVKMKCLRDKKFAGTDYS